MLSVFYALHMSDNEDCASFSSKLEQQLSHVQAMYPAKLTDSAYWNILRDRFFHGLHSSIRTNVRSDYAKNTSYYELLQTARVIEN